MLACRLPHTQVPLDTSTCGVGRRARVDRVLVQPSRHGVSERPATSNAIHTWAGRVGGNPSNWNLPTDKRGVPVAPMATSR